VNQARESEEVISSVEQNIPLLQHTAGMTQYQKDQVNKLRQMLYDKWNSVPAVAERAEYNTLKLILEDSDYDWEAAMIYMIGSCKDEKAFNDMHTFMLAVIAAADYTACPRNSAGFINPRINRGNLPHLDQREQEEYDY
jgi:hypothetical protein